MLEQRPTLSEAELRSDLARVELDAIRDYVKSSGDHQRLYRLIEHYEWRARTVGDNTKVAAGHEGSRKAQAEATLVAVAASRKELLKLYQQGIVHDSLMDKIEEELDLEERSARKFLR